MAQPPATASLVVVLALALLCLASLGLGAVSSDVPLCSDMGIQIRKTILSSEEKIDDFNLIYASGDNQIMFMRTRRGDIYRTADEGDTWEKQTVNSKMANVESSPGRVTAIFVARNDATGNADVLYFLGALQQQQQAAQKIWVSLDQGQTYISATLPTGPQTIYIAPHHTNTMKALGYTLSRKDNIMVRGLALTEDGGRSWRTVATGLFSYDVTWGFRSEHPNRLYAVTGDPADPYSAKLVFTDDFFAKTVTLRSNVWYFSLHNEDDIVVGEWIRVPGQTPTQSMIVLSTDGGVNWDIADFPSSGFEDRRANTWYLYDDSEDSIFVAEDKSLHSPSWAHLFKSHSFDREFTLSQRFQKPQEFTKYESIHGVYVSSFYNTSMSPGDPISTTPVQSRISYNKGGKWLPLKRPLGQFDGQPFPCARDHPDLMDTECSLHLHGYSSATANTWFYSVPNAIGSMIASGNVGSKVIVDRENTNTYYSRDAGSTWEEVADGPHIPEFGDHGGIIILADGDDPVDTIVFHDGEMSADNKKTIWHTCRISDVKMFIQNVRVGPMWNSKQFVVYGNTVSSSSSWPSHPAIISVDFANRMPACTASDFETFTPMAVDGSCILGVANSYKRRRTGARCWNGERFESEASSKACTCTINDFECEHCFSYDPLTQQCIFDCYNEPTAVQMLGLPASTCANNETSVLVPMGWRKIHGDACDHSNSASIQLPNGTIQCNHWRQMAIPVISAPGDDGIHGGQPHMTGAIIAIIVILIVVVAVITFYIVWTRTDLIHSLFGHSGHATHAGMANSGYERLAIVTSEDMDAEDEDA